MALTRIEKRNKARAQRAFDLLAPYLSRGDARKTCIIDLLTDLRHYCAQNGVDFGNALQLSDDHYRAEVAGIDD